MVLHVSTLSVSVSVMSDDSFSLKLKYAAAYTYVMALQNVVVIDCPSLTMFYLYIRRRCHMWRCIHFIVMQLVTEFCGRCSQILHKTRNLYCNMNNLKYAICINFLNLFLSILFWIICFAAGRWKQKAYLEEYLRVSEFKIYVCMYLISE